VNGVTFITLLPLLKVTSASSGEGRHRTVGVVCPLWGVYPNHPRKGHPVVVEEYRSLDVVVGVQGPVGGSLNLHRLEEQRGFVVPCSLVPG